MEKRRPIINKIVITAALVCIACPTLYYRTVIVTAVIIAIILVIQHRLDEKYPYDMAAYVYHLSNDDKAAAINQIEDFAHNCPAYDPKTCLCDTMCPDCPYGHY